jgi:hypothetical protein
MSRSSAPNHFRTGARGSQWLLSRQIAAAKAFTANGLSLDGAPLSTAQLYPWVQPGAPGNPLFGLAGGNPVSPEEAHSGPYSQFGTRLTPASGNDRITLDNPTAHPHCPNDGDTQGRS